MPVAPEPAELKGAARAVGSAARAAGVLWPNGFPESLLQPNQASKHLRSALNAERVVRRAKSAGVRPRETPRETDGPRGGGRREG
eukprot:scaffold517_cov255-Pinguiococcus_pyrenoidosus.AAC.24